MIKTRLALLTLVVASAFAAPLSHPTTLSNEAAEELFSSWQLQHGKTYGQEDVAHRFSVFRSNAEAVARHNAQGKSYWLELNKFADMTVEEFRSMLGFRAVSNNAAQNVSAISGSAPDSIDWRTKGAVTPVQNQGQCGSCWAFSATGSLEGANFIKNGKLTQLSVQQLLDCDTKGDDQACNGGLMDNAFKYVIANGGIDSADDYKYLARQSMFFRCPASKSSKHVGTCSAFTDVPANSEAQLQLAVAQQPVSVAIEADTQTFQLYGGGILDDASCGTNLDHGVLAVGYGSDAGKDYWIVKNSWGAQWGEQGFIRLARNVADSKGQCGIAMSASYPTA